ncbi:MAG: hypothetical protein R3E01_07550 [Pirellulaceae bacterium]
MHPGKTRARIAIVGLFLTVLFLGDRLMARAVDAVFMRTKFRYPMLYAGELPADIVFLGNSRALHMFHCPAVRETTGLRAANIGFNGLPTIAMAPLWHDYLEHHAPPALLVLEVSCVGREDEDGALERFTTCMRHSDEIASQIARRNRLVYSASQLSHLYRYNSELTWRSLFFLRNSDQDWIMEGQVDRSEAEELTDADVPSLLRSADNVAAFQRIIDVAAAHGVEVRLVHAPYLTEYRRHLHDAPTWTNWLQSELEHPILDYTDAIVDPTSFADPIHLNAGGARQLAIRMARDGVLPSQDD